jgi:hypothetical protein
MTCQRLKPKPTLGKTQRSAAKFQVSTRSHRRGKPTFINFDRPYPNQDFTVMIWHDERAGFGSLERIQVAKFVPTELLQSTGASRRWFCEVPTRYRPSKLETGR